MTRGKAVLRPSKRSDLGSGQLPLAAQRVSGITSAPKVEIWSTSSSALRLRRRT